MAIKFSMPVASWQVLKKIIRAYGQVADSDHPTVDEVAKIAGMPRPQISANNNFLRETGFLLPEENKLTPLGLRMAQGLALENQEIATGALRDIVRANGTLNHFVGIVRARSPIATELLRGEIAIAAGVSDRTKQPGAIRTVLDLLEEAGLIIVQDDTIRSGTPFSDMSSGLFPNVNGDNIPPARPPVMPSPDSKGTRIPLPLGPTRLAYLELPDNWQPKELPRLIKLLEIALADSDAEVA